MQDKSSHQQFIEDIENTAQILLHQILFYRKLYPQIIFETKNVWGLSVNIVKQGILYDYIKQLFDNLEDLLKADALQSIIINLYNNGEIQEKYQFEISTLVNLVNCEYLPKQFEKDIHFKTFIASAIEKLQAYEGYDFIQFQESNKFEILIKTNGLETSQNLAKDQLITNWILEQNKEGGQEGKQTLLSAVGFGQINFSFAKI